MENKEFNMENQIVATETNVYRECKCCGRALPLTKFKAYKGNKHSTTCLDCLKKEDKSSERFKQFTTRELLDELKQRGWRGELKYVEVKSIKL